MQRIKFFLLSFLIIGNSLLYHRCTPKGPSGPKVMQDAVSNIISNPENWESILNKVLDDLPEDDIEFRGLVNKLLEQGLSAASSNIACVVDAVPERMTQGLQKIETKNNPFLSTPTVCHTSLDVIDLKLPETDRTHIVIQGYDFPNNNSLKLELRKASGGTTSLGNRLSQQSKFQFTIDIANMEAILKDHDFLVLLSEEEIVVAFTILAKPPVFHSFIPPTLHKLCPTHIGGDREFNGNGPRVRAIADIFVLNQKEVHLKVTFHVRETVADFTEARGEWTTKIFPTASNPAPSASYTINRITTDNRSSALYVDNDHSPDQPNVTGGLVNKFICVGDTNGNDVGNCNGDNDSNLTVVFNAITIEIED